MCVNLLHEDLNPNPYPLHFISTYICGISITQRVYDGIDIIVIISCMCL